MSASVFYGFYRKAVLWNLCELVVLKDKVIMLYLQLKSENLGNLVTIFQNLRKVAASNPLAQFQKLRTSIIE